MENARVKPMHRFNTKIRENQRDFIKGEVKKSKGALSEGEIARELLDLGIEVYKNKKKK